MSVFDHCTYRCKGFDSSKEKIQRDMLHNLSEKHGETRCVCNDDMRMPCMGQKLKGFAEKGHMFESDKAWFRYQELAGESSHDIP